jgi:UPF0755 protein
VALLGVLVVAAACAVPDARHGVRVTIPDGPVEAVAESLAAHGIVSSAESFARFARMGRKHLGIKAGVYPLVPGTPMGKVLATLRRGRAPEIRLEVRSGIWISELAPIVEQVMGIPADSFRGATHDSTVRDAVGAESESVEGYLFPATYYVPVGASAEQIVRQLVDTFEARWRPGWTARADSLGFTRHQVVTLASIIEGEDPHHADLGYVSSVYHNRLANGRRLQADPTVVYALGERRRLYNKDYAFQSPFNTYRVAGLPPSPIGQASLASLEAALYPIPSDFLYFVARRDGRHVFSRTYGEHLATIRAVRRRGGIRAPDE